MTVEQAIYIYIYSYIFIYICVCVCVCVGRVIPVGIVTRYGLDGPGIESRWGARFSPPVQTGPGVHPASCTRYRVFPGAKATGTWR